MVVERIKMSTRFRDAGTTKLLAYHRRTVAKDRRCHSVLRSSSLCKNGRHTCTFVLSSRGCVVVVCLQIAGYGLHDSEGQCRGRGGGYVKSSSRTLAAGPSMSRLRPQSVPSPMWQDNPGSFLSILFFHLHACSRMSLFSCGGVSSTVSLSRGATPHQLDKHTTTSRQPKGFSSPTNTLWTSGHGPGAGRCGVCSI